MTSTGERPTSGNLNIIFDSVAPDSPPAPSWWVASRMAGGDIVRSSLSGLGTRTSSTQYSRAEVEIVYVCGYPNLVTQYSWSWPLSSWSDSPTRRRGREQAVLQLPRPPSLPSIRQPSNLDWTTKYRDPWSGSSWKAPVPSHHIHTSRSRPRTSLPGATSDVAPPSPELLLQTAKRAWMRPDDAGLAEPWIQIVLRPGCRVLSDLVEGNRLSASRGSRSESGQPRGGKRPEPCPVADLWISSQSLSRETFL